MLQIPRSFLPGALSPKARLHSSVPTAERKMIASSGGRRSPSWTSHALPSIPAVTPQPFIASSIHRFDSINKKEKRMEKPTTTAVTSTVTMGKAMGAGSGIGRAGAGALRTPQNPLMGSGMGIDMGIGMNNGPGAAMGMGIGMNNGPGAGMGIAGYGGINPLMGMGMSMGMGMGMGMGQGVQMKPPMGMPLGSNMPGNYNKPMMGPRSYAQQPYGGCR